MNSSVQQIMVPNDIRTPLRLDEFLKTVFPWLSRNAVRRYVDAGHISIEGQLAHRHTRVEPGDRLECRNVPLENTSGKPIPNPALPLVVRWEDDVLLGLDKPAGMPTHPLDFHETNTLVNALLARYPSLASIGPDPLFPAVLHRLDTQTSGLLIAAKTQAAYDRLRNQFRTFKVEKHYTALVHGIMTHSGECALSLTHQSRHPCKMKVVKPNLSGRDIFRAKSVWTPIRMDTKRQMSLVDVCIFTGVTHQIRCHLAYSGFPIVGDGLYGSPAALPRHFLHASRIRFEHPATRQPCDLETPLPDGFAEAEYP